MLRLICCCDYNRAADELLRLGATKTIFGQPREDLTQVIP